MSPILQWNEDIPSDGSAVAGGAREIRNLWGTLTDGLNESLEWSATGQLRAGVAPSFVTTEANIASLFESNASSTGKLAFASDTSRLYTLGIAATVGRAAFAGGPQLMEHVDQVPAGHSMLIQSGSSLLVTPDGNSVITFNSNGMDSSDAVVYGTSPKVFVTSDNRDYMPIIRNVTGKRFTVQMRPIQDAATDVTIRWVSSGTSTI